MLRGIALLLVVWWAWVGYSWLTNSVPVDDDVRSRIVVFAAMAAGLVMGLAIPNAFGDDGVLFGFAYLTVTLLFVLLYAVATRDRPGDEPGSPDDWHPACWPLAGPGRDRGVLRRRCLCGRCSGRSRSS